MNRRRLRPWLIGGLGSLAAATTLVSCSRQASDVLQVGGAIALTGNASLLGQDARTGLEIAQHHYGQQQPQLKLVIEDTGSDEASATQAFRRLINNRVVAILGPSLSQQGFAVMPMAERAGIPVIGISTTAPGIPEIGRFVTRVASPVTVIAPRSLAKAIELTPRKAHAFTANQVVHEALARVKANLPKGTTLISLPESDLRQQLLSTLLAMRFQTPLGEIRFTPEGEVIQKDFSVARVSMGPDGSGGRFVLLK